MFAGRRKMRSIQDPFNHISRVPICQSIPGCDKSDSSPLEWARFHSPGYPLVLGGSCRRSKSIPEPAAMRDGLGSPFVAIAIQIDEPGDPHSGRPVAPKIRPVYVIITMT